MSNEGTSNSHYARACAYERLHELTEVCVRSSIATLLPPLPPGCQCSSFCTLACTLHAADEDAKVDVSKAEC